MVCGAAGKGRGPGVCPWGTGLPHLFHGRSPSAIHRHSQLSDHLPSGAPTVVWPCHSTCQPPKELLGHRLLTHVTDAITPEASGSPPPCGRARPWSPPQSEPHTVALPPQSSPRGLASSPAPATKAVGRNPSLAVHLSPFKVLSPLPLPSHMGGSPLSSHFLLGHVVHSHHLQWPRCPRMPHVRPSQGPLSPRPLLGLQTRCPFPSPSPSRGLGATISISMFSWPGLTGHQLLALTRPCSSAHSHLWTQTLKVSLRTCHLTSSWFPLTPGT